MSLPVPVDSFVGREDELADGIRLLGESRLLTLVGPGGVGKTRLALCLASQVVGRHDVSPQRCWLVDLSAAGADLDLPMLIVSAALGMARAKDPVRVLAEELGNEPALLVVDNCEHVTTEVAEALTALLDRCAGLRVIATSQLLLEVPGEVAYPLEGLPVPDAKEEDADWVSSAAVRLFADRARDIYARFTVVPEVAEICARLDGVPLAIELAARWVRMLNPAEILAELTDDRFGLLTSVPGPDQGSNRHHSLRDVIERSYSLLNADERALVRRLAVLPGPFDLDTAVAAGGGARAGVLRLLRQLVATSMLNPVRPAPSEPQPRSRFRMLESIREFGLDQVSAHGEDQECRARLVRWYTELCAPMADPELSVYPSALWWRLDDDRDNLAAALEWARAGGDEDAQRLLGVSLATVWEKLGWRDQAAALKWTLPDPPDGDARQWCMILYALASSAIHGRDTDGAIALADRLERAAADGGFPMYQVRARRFLSFAHQEAGRSAAAAAAYESAIKLADEVGRPEVAAAVRSDLAWVALQDGELERAAKLLDEAIPVMRTTADPLFLATALHASGLLAVRLDDIPTADERFREGLNLARHYSEEYSDCLLGLATVALSRHDPRRGLRLAAAGRRSPAPGVYDFAVYWNDRTEVTIAECRAALSVEEAEQAWHDGGELTPDEAIDYALDGAWPTRLTVDDVDLAPSPAPENPLSPRELEIALMVAEGLTNREVAARLAVSVRTVDAHLEHIRTKLNLRSRAQIGTWLAQHHA